MFFTRKKSFGEYLGDMVYGANDGIITTFAIVSAGAGATLAGDMIVIVGVANLFADAFSMGASSYLSIKTTEMVKNRRRMFWLFNGDANRRSLATFGAFVVAGSMPLLPFVTNVADENVFVVSAFAAGCAFFIVGGLRTFVTKKGFIVSGLEIVLIGGAAAALAYAIGAFVESIVV